MGTVVLPGDGSCIWSPMGELRIVTPDKKNTLELSYGADVPGGDTYHSATANERDFPGYVWGRYFASSQDSRYLVCSWMMKTFDAKTIVIDYLE